MKPAPKTNLFKLREDLDNVHYREIVTEYALVTKIVPVRHRMARGYVNDSRTFFIMDTGQEGWLYTDNFHRAFEEIKW